MLVHILWFKNTDFVVSMVRAYTVEDDSPSPSLCGIKLVCIKTWEKIGNNDPFLY